MNSLPVLERELRLSARRPFTYYGRSGTAAVASFVSLGMLFAGFGGLVSPASAGRSLFVTLSILGYCFVLAAGAFSTADSLSQEKREGTIGLLFLTHLRGYDVVAGKFMSHAWQLFYYLLAALPVPSFAFFMGGVTIADFLRLAVVLFNALFFSAGLGLFISAVSHSESKAVCGALGLVGFLGGLLPAEGCLYQSITGATTIPSIFLVFGPAGGFLATLSPALCANSTFALSLLLTHLMAWGFLALACFLLPRTWQDKALTPPAAVRKTASPPIVGASPPPAPDELTDPWHEVNPVYWMGRLTSRRSFSLTHSFCLLGVLWLLALVLYPQGWINPVGWQSTSSGVPNGWFDPPVFIGAALVSHYVLRFLVAAQACRSLAEDRRSGVLELLLTTPLSEDEILRGRLLALKRQFLVPTAIVLGMDGVLVLTGLPRLQISSQMALLTGFGVAIFLLLADLYALAWVGLWRGLSCLHTSRAIRQSLFGVLLLPWLGVLGALAVVGVLSQGRMAGEQMAGVAFIAAGVFFMANTAGFIGWAINSLRDDFRALATQAFLAPPARQAWRKAS